MKMTRKKPHYRLLCALFLSGSLLGAAVEGATAANLVQDERRHDEDDRRRVVQAPYHFSYAMHYSKGKGGSTMKSKGKGKGSMGGKGKGSSKKMQKSAKGYKGGKGKGMPPLSKGYKGYYNKGKGLGGGPGMMTPPTQFPTFDSNLIDTSAPTRSCNQQDCCTDADCGDADLYECRANACLLRECSLDSNGNDPPLNIECCTDTDCGSTDGSLICKENVCINTGNPRFTLSWFGYDDLDLHVITPGGVEIDYTFTVDPESGGQLDQDDIPNVTARWVENIYFPRDGSAPTGEYTFFVVAYNVNDEADNYDLGVWEGDTRVFFVTGGGLEIGEESSRYTHVMS